MVEGGKDDDIINEQYKWNPVGGVGEDGDYGYFKKDKAKTWVEHEIDDIDKKFATDNLKEYLYGNSGDDTIWLSSTPSGGKQLADGGTGNDKVYGGHTTTDSEGITLLGGAGRDLIRSDWWQEFANPLTAITDGKQNEYLYGDYKYGDGTGANFDEALEDQLWGDDDIIHGQDGIAGKSQKIFGGDGDDEIYSGDTWGGHEIHGNDGDDLIINGTIGALHQNVYGNDGNDTIRSKLDFANATPGLGG